MSSWSDKIVWFEVTVHDPKDDYYDDYIGMNTVVKQFKTRNLFRFR